MNGIIGMTVLTLESELTRQQRENLMIVSSLASSLLTIIDDILDISKSKSIVSRPMVVRQLTWIRSRGWANDYGTNTVLASVGSLQCIEDSVC